METKISPSLVKDLREATGAGMMSCKKALQETEGNYNEAVKLLRQKGLAFADKKVGRQTCEGLIGCYIHTGGKLGVLYEINCETDFVARRPEFQEFSKNIGMQIAACPTVAYVSINDIPKEVIEIERKKQEDCVYCWVVGFDPRRSVSLPRKSQRTRRCTRRCRRG